MTEIFQLTDLNQFTGTEQRYRHPLFPKFTYTDGVQYVAEHGRAYWLIEAIFSWQNDPIVSAEPFQTWTLTVFPDRTGLLVATNGNGTHLAEQILDYTDFPLTTITIYLMITLYLINDVLLLPSEY